MTNPPGVTFGQTSGTPTAAPGFGRLGSAAGLALALVIVGGLLWSAGAGHAVSAKHPRLFGGTLVLEDQRQLTVIDVATGAVVVGLQAVHTEVGAAAEGDVQAVPLTAGTMLIDRRSGTFNLLGKDNYVLDGAGAGVGLGHLPGLTTAYGLPAGENAYIVRYAPHSTVSLVGAATVLAGAKLEQSTPSRPARSVTPLGYTALGGPVAPQPGSGAVSGRDLWILLATGSSCQVRQLQPVATGHNGLTSTLRAKLPTSCRQAAIEAIPGAVGVAYPGHVRLFPSNRPGRALDVPVRGNATASTFVPVGGASAALWYLAATPGGWAVFGVTPAGRAIGPSPLQHFGSGAQPVTPVESRGVLYTLDRATRGQPTLWTILPSTGAMIPVSGAVTYPRRVSTEQATFGEAEVLVDGPRVVFNNPGSLLAVMLFTDGSHIPVVIDKSSALAISTVGPTVASSNARAAQRGTARSKTTTAPRSAPRAPVVQAVNPSVTCANTTQKPYAPQITSIAPSSGSALVSWSYQLLDQGDCEPDSWAVTMTALSSSHQPTQPVQVVNGQTQLEFTGLRPATTYEAVVTAYINQQSTASTPATFTTAARGPDAPTAVRTVADGHGHWVVTWAPCTNANCFIPADSWNVIGAACGGAFVGQPPTIQVPGGQTGVTIDADRLGLLGTSLTFSVQGVLNSGLPGGPTSDHACTEAWRLPDPAHIRVGAAGVQASASQTITATVQVAPQGTSAVEAFGSRSTEFVYSVGGHTVGPTTAATLTLPGLAGGTSYTPSVRVYPSGHPDAAVVLPGPTFRQNLAWPQPPALALHATPVVGADPNTGTLILSFLGLPAGPMVAEDGTITCGSTQYPLIIHNQAVINRTFTIPGFDLVNYGGVCAVSLVVASASIPNPYGGVSSPALSSSFAFGTQPDYRFTDQISPTCQRTFCPPGQQQIEVDYAGAEPAVLRAGSDWLITSSGGGGPGRGHGNPGACAATIGEPPGTPPTFPIVLTLPPTCPDASPVDITVTYRYLGQTTTVDAGTPSGTPATTTTTTTTTTSTTTTTTTTTSPTSTSTSTTTPRSTTTRTTTRAGGAAPLATSPPAASPGDAAKPIELAGAAVPAVSALPAGAAVPPVPAVAAVFPGPEDAQVRAGLLWALLAVPLACCAGVIRRAPRRRRARRTPR